MNLAEIAKEYPMNILDAFIILIFIYNVMRGFKKGIIEEVISIVGIVVSALLAIKLAHPVAKLLVNPPDTPSVVAAGAIIYLVSFVIFKYIAYNLNMLYSSGVLGVINNILGTFFGFFRGIILATLFVLFMALVAPKSDTVSSSLFVRILEPVADEIVKLAPERARQTIISRWELAKKNIMKKHK